MLQGSLVSEVSFDLNVLRRRRCGCRGRPRHLAVGAQGRPLERGGGGIRVALPEREPESEEGALHVPGDVDKDGDRLQDHRHHGRHLHLHAQVLHPQHVPVSRGFSNLLVQPNNNRFEISVAPGSRDNSTSWDSLWTRKRSRSRASWIRSRVSRIR